MTVAPTPIRNLTATTTTPALEPLATAPVSTTQSVSPQARLLAAKNAGVSSSVAHGAKKLPTTSPLFMGFSSSKGPQVAVGGNGGGEPPRRGPGRDLPADKVDVPPSAEELKRARDAEARRLQASMTMWANGLNGVSGADAITKELATRGWSATKFENLVSYGSADQVRALLRFDDRHQLASRSDDVVLGTPLPAAICGQTANRLAQCLLGPDKGSALSDGLNGALRAQPIAPPQGVLVGHGLGELAEACASETHAVCLLQLGPNHRLIFERRPDDTVTILQGWIDQFSLADWLDVGAQRNDAKINRPMGEALGLLDQAISDPENSRRMAANRALFESPARPLRDNLDRGVAVTFTMVPVEPYSVKDNVRAFFDDPGSLR